MNRCRIRKILLASVIVLALFDVLWKQTAPFRMKPQFEAQAMAQLRGRLPVNGKKFKQIEVHNLHFVGELGEYHVEYWTWVSLAKSGGTMGLSNECYLTQAGNLFEGECVALIDMISNDTPTFKIRIKK